MKNQQLVIPFGLEKLIFTDSGFSDEAKMTLLKTFQNRFRGVPIPDDQSTDPMLRSVAESFLEGFLLDEENREETERQRFEDAVREYKEKESERKRKNAERVRKSRQKKEDVTLHYITNVTSISKEEEEERTEEKEKKESDIKKEENKEEKKKEVEEKKENNLKEKSKIKRFVKPTVEEIRAYCQERNNGINAEAFFDFYESKGWVVGKSPMKSWKAAVRTWERSGSGSSGWSDNGRKPPVVLEREQEERNRIEHKKLDEDLLKSVQHLL